MHRSRWADSEEDQTLEAQRKQEKEAKRRAKAERQSKLQDKAQRSEVPEIAPPISNGHNSDENGFERPSKRRRLSPETPVAPQATEASGLLRFPALGWEPCRHVDNFEKLNHIEEGSYGWVSRAKEVATGEVVALKKLKMDNLNDGFPVTGLREIQTLQASRHDNIVVLREVVMGDQLDE